MYLNYILLFTHIYEPPSKLFGEKIYQKYHQLAIITMSGIDNFWGNLSCCGGKDIWRTTFCVYLTFFKLYAKLG